MKVYAQSTRFVLYSLNPSGDLPIHLEQKFSRMTILRCVT